MRTYLNGFKLAKTACRYLIVGSLPLTLASAAPLARQPDLRNGSKTKSPPSNKNTHDKRENLFIEPSTEDLLSDQPMLKSEGPLPEKLPEMLPEDPEMFTPPPKKSARAPKPEAPSAPAKDSPTNSLLGIPTAPAASSATIEENPPPSSTESPSITDSASAMKPEVDTTIEGVDESVSSDIAEFPPEAPSDTHADIIDEPLDEERLVSEPESDPAVVASDSSSGSGTSEKKWERGVPRYDQERPSLGFQLMYSPDAIGSDLRALNELGTAVESYTMTQVGVGVEWQPTFVQSIGVIAIGGSANVYPVTPLNGITNGGLDIWSVGFSAKYQAKWFRGQWVVPYVGYEAQYLNYRTETNEIGSGTAMLTGPVFGALLLLNWMEPKAAFEMYDNTGIKRSYLFAEMRSLVADTEPQFSTNGNSLHFGIRFEL